MSRPKALLAPIPQQLNKRRVHHNIVNTQDVGGIHKTPNKDRDENKHFKVELNRKYTTKIRNERT